MRRSLSGLAVLACCSSAFAGELIPSVEPDVVLECVRNGEASPTCYYSCLMSTGFVPPACLKPPCPPQQPSVPASGFGFSGVTRVEMYYYGEPGRDDGRFWVAVEHQSFTGLGYNTTISFLNLGENAHCSFPAQDPDPDDSGFRITSFR